MHANKKLVDRLTPPEAFSESMFKHARYGHMTVKPKVAKSTTKFFLRRANLENRIGAVLNQLLNCMVQALVEIRSYLHARLSITARIQGTNGSSLS